MNSNLNYGWLAFFSLYYKRTYVRTYLIESEGQFLYGSFHLLYSSHTGQDGLRGRVCLIAYRLGRHAYLVEDVS